jgi:uncharacterized membrane protein
MSLVPAIIAAALAFHGWRKKSLSPGGAVAAFIIGFLMLAVPLRAFGISLIVFYITGSRATKCEPRDVSYLKLLIVFRWKITQSCARGRIS